jgi:hypothetical protein
MNNLAKIGLISFGLLTLPKVFQSASNYLLAQGIQLNFKPNIQSTKDGLQLICKLELINPTDKSLSFTSPLIGLMHQGELLSQNQASGNIIEIKAKSKTCIPIRLFLKWEQLQQIFSSFQSSNTNPLDLALKITKPRLQDKQ